MVKEKIKNSLLIKFLNNILRRVMNPAFYSKIMKFKKTKKIIYTITPPPHLRNIGDHAQVVAIKKWFSDNFEDYLVLEFDKKEIYRYLSSIKKIVNKADLIFCHSGGNLGDRGLWSEGARRLVIKTFPENKIISLPQTIFFSDTRKGKDELEITKKIYNNHKDLTIMARDRYSFELAKQYFPECKHMICPDFVLYLDSFDGNVEKRENVLLCLRNDTESIINDDIRNSIREYIKNGNQECHNYDTTLKRYIPRKNREKELKLVLSLFRKHKLVITDRFHGVIFSIITRVPCIALKTVDHKLTESVKWFKSLNYLFYTENYDQLPELMNKAYKIAHFNKVNWKKLYFNSLKSRIMYDKSIDSNKFEND